MAHGVRNAAAAGSAEVGGGRGRGPQGGRLRIADGTGRFPVGRGWQESQAKGRQAHDGRMEILQEEAQGPDADRPERTPRTGRQAEEKGEHEGLPVERWQEYRWGLYTI